MYKVEITLHFYFYNHRQYLLKVTGSTSSRPKTPENSYLTNSIGKNLWKRVMHLGMFKIGYRTKFSNFISNILLWSTRRLGSSGTQALSLFMDMNEKGTKGGNVNDLGPRISRLFSFPSAFPSLCFRVL